MYRALVLCVAIAACKPVTDATDTDLPGNDDTDDTDACTPITSYSDGDGDGFGDPLSRSEDCVVPEGNVADSTDCDDGAVDVSPAGLEHCDGRDEDCDGTVDDDPTDAVTWYADLDIDGYGDPASMAQGCEAPFGSVSNEGDCDDDEPLAWTGHPEICGDGVDNDCDGRVGSDCLISGEHDLGDVDAHHYDGVTYGLAGQALAIVDDADGDGVRDVMIGAMLASTGRLSYDGVAYLASGDSGGGLSGALGSLSGVGDYADAGSAVCGIGDVDGDSSQELAVGSRGTYTALEYDPGTVMIVETNSSGKMSLKFTIEGTDATQGFGGTLAPVGDVNGDGRDDLAVGAYSTNYYAGTKTGAVWLLTDLDSVGSTTASSVGIRMLGPTNSWIGSFLSSPGDVDGDGMADLLVGGAGTTFGGPKIAWLITDPPSSNADIDDVAAAIVSTTTSDLYLSGVWGVGDVDGDGLVDIGVGSFYDDDGATDAGAVYVLTAPSGEVDVSAAYAKILGDGAGDQLGQSAVTLGDLDGDGFGDMAVGAWLDGTGGSHAGAVYGMMSPKGTVSVSTAALTLVGDADTWTGQRMVSGDLDGDGGIELLISSPHALGGYGRVFVVSLGSL
jgi:hypothetical protein